MRPDSSVMQSIARFGARLACAVARGRITILTYHRVAAVPDPLLPDEPDVQTFEWQMRVLATQFKPMRLLDAMQRLEAGRLPAGTVCVTFDDGYADNVLVALPVLKRWDVPATFFIASGYLNGGRMFNDTIIETVRRLRSDELEVPWLGLARMPLRDAAERRAAFQSVIDVIKYRSPSERSELSERFAALCAEALPRELMMTTDQVRQLAHAGMTVGAHTRTHPILAQIDRDVARAEIEDGKAELEGILGEPVEVFAYPNGRPGRDYAPEHVTQARKAGFRFAASTNWGCVVRGSDPWQLPRVAPLGASEQEFALRTARSYLSRASDPPAASAT